MCTALDVSAYCSCIHVQCAHQHDQAVSAGNQACAAQISKRGRSRHISPVLCGQVFQLDDKCYTPLGITVLHQLERHLLALFATALQRFGFRLCTQPFPFVCNLITRPSTRRVSIPHPNRSGVRSTRSWHLKSVRARAPNSICPPRFMYSAGAIGDTQWVFIKPSVNSW